MSPKLYSVPTSPSFGFVRSVAKHINIDLCVRHLDFTEEHLNDEYVKLSPVRKVPTLEDGRFVVHESAAIAYYLLSKYAPQSQLYPLSPRQRNRIDQIMVTIASTIRPHFVEFFRRIFCDNSEPTTMEIAAFEETVIKGLEHLVGKGPFATGDNLTLADLCIIANLNVAFTNGFVDIAKFPTMVGYYGRVAEVLPYFPEVYGDSVDFTHLRWPQLVPTPPISEESAGEQPMTSKEQVTQEDQEEQMTPEEPSKSEDKEEPSKSEDKEEPSKSEDKEEPSKSEDKEEPSKSEDKEEPSKSEDKEEPSKSEDKEEQSKSKDKEERMTSEYMVEPMIGTGSV
ncbi:glutathione S-transferase 1-like [Dermacentor variabilis]|uniref:glutathione S-transferase 1-like n=1 Tax=Dermacentor variabilis TaxID=34621 RepID=UPI003F5BFE56